MSTVTDVPTEVRLLSAAERLFAAHGVEGVSLRTVMSEARANVASVHYHFGSKEALLAAVVRSRLDEITEARALVLDELAVASQPSVRDLARALVGPVAAVAANGGRNWVKLIGTLISTNDPGLDPAADSFFARNARFIDLMERCDPTASAQTLSFRLTLAMSITLQVLGDAENLQSLMAGGGRPWSESDVNGHLLDVVTSVLAGPPAHPSE